MDDDGAPPLTQGNKSHVQYGSIFLFKEDIDENYPFSVVPLNFFGENDFPWNAIRGEMSSECRGELRTFSNLDGQYRIFGKIEKGM